MKTYLILPSIVALLFSNNFAFNNVDKHDVSFVSNLTTNYNQLSQDEIFTYYSTLENGEKGEDLLIDLQNILKVNQKKVNYSTGYTDGINTSKSWYGYMLYERNRDLSPLEESEANGEFKTSGIWINVMYVNSPIFIDNKINSGTFKYYPNYPDTTAEPIEGEFGGSIGIDREHVFPKSYGFNESGTDLYEELTVGCDAHNLHAGERAGNQKGHNNLPYGDVETNPKPITNSLTGEIAGYVGLNEDDIEVFEPLDKDKGDIARSIFYMAARYHSYEDLGNGDETPSLALGNKIEDHDYSLKPSETINSPAIYGELDDLLRWNKEDPVTDFERYRNDLIFNNIQGNRNPFVDFPNWADACFNPNNSSGISFDTSEVTNYTLNITTTDEFKDSYIFMDKFTSKGLKITLIDNENKEVEPTSINYYLDNVEIKDGDTITTIGDKKFYITITTPDGRKLNSEVLIIKVSFSLVQLVVASVIIILLVIILLVIFFRLSKSKKKKVIKTVKNKIKKN